MAAKKILLVVSEEPFRVALVEQLELNGEFEVISAESGAAALEKVNTDVFAAILLDFDLGNLDGTAVCRILRRSHVQCPIIMLIPSDCNLKTKLGIDVGVNDYVIKPVRINILLSRIRSQLYQYDRSENSEIYIGPYIFQPSAKKLLRHGNKNNVRLTDKETAILIYLFRARNKAVSRDVLLNEVWGYNAEVTTHTLETHIYRLRQKIEVNPSLAKILITEPGGYRLVP